MEGMLEGGVLAEPVETDELVQDLTSIFEMKAKVDGDGDEEMGGATEAKATEASTTTVAANAKWIVPDLAPLWVSQLEKTMQRKLKTLTLGADALEMPETGRTCD